MILIGQYDSPFVRRVGIALTLYGLPFEHRPWSAFSDRQRLAEISPLTRVPVLVLPEGQVLVDSGLILDHLDHQVPAERRLFPAPGPLRARALATTGLALGLAEKMVALFYEGRFHDRASPGWGERLTGQITATLRELELRRAACATSWFAGASPGHDDIMLACALRFGAEAHPALLPRRDHPALAAHAAQAEALPAFQTISQPFLAPA